MLYFRAENKDVFSLLFLLFFLWLGWTQGKHAVILRKEPVRRSYDRQGSTTFKDLKEPYLLSLP